MLNRRIKQLLNEKNQVLLELYVDNYVNENINKENKLNDLRCSFDICPTTDDEYTALKSAVKYVYDKLVNVKLESALLCMSHAYSGEDINYTRFFDVVPDMKQSYDLCLSAASCGGVESNYMLSSMITSCSELDRCVCIGDQCETLRDSCMKLPEDYLTYLITNNGLKDGDERKRILDEINKYGKTATPETPEKKKRVSKAKTTSPKTPNKKKSVPKVKLETKKTPEKKKRVSKAKTASPKTPNKKKSVTKSETKKTPEKKKRVSKPKA